MKLWNSMKQGAGKLAFEADRMMRVKKEEAAIEEARKQIAAVTANIGAVALSLFRSGSLDEPQVASLVTQIDEIEATIAQHQAAVEQIKAEVAPGAEGEVAPAATLEAEPAQPPLEPMQRAPAAAPVVEQAAPTAETAQPAARKCPNCGADAPATGSFCPECGARL